MSVRIYVEGGGNRASLRQACRKGFRGFFEKSGMEGRMPKVIACGSRRAAYEDFCRALEDGTGVALLLVDAEAKVRPGEKPWEHLRRHKQDQWPRPKRARDDQCHLMVQCMETWFLADRPCLETFFGQGFIGERLPAGSHLEAISKEDVFQGLANASRGARSKRRYGKGAHSFAILAAIDPQRVRSACPHADRLLSTLEELCRG